MVKLLTLWWWTFLTLPQSWAVVHNPKTKSLTLLQRQRNTCPWLRVCIPLLTPGCSLPTLQCLSAMSGWCLSRETHSVIAKFMKRINEISSLLTKIRNTLVMEANKVQHVKSLLWRSNIGVLAVKAGLLIVFNSPYLGSLCALMTFAVKGF